MPPQRSQKRIRRGCLIRVLKFRGFFRSGAVKRFRAVCMFFGSVVEMSSSFRYK